MRDLVGSILFLSLKQKVDMGEVLNFHRLRYLIFLQVLIEVWKKKHSHRAKLLQELELGIASIKPASIDVMIIDKIFLLHLLVDPPSTFVIAWYMVGHICSTTSHEIHFVFDKIIHPSIKDCERDAQSFDRSASCSITWSSQKRPSSWLAALCNMSIFKALWYSNTSALTIITHYYCLWTIIMNYSFTVEDQGMCKMCKRSLSMHEETDSRMIFHLYSVINP